MKYYFCASCQVVFGDEELPSHRVVPVTITPLLTCKKCGKIMYPAEGSDFGYAIKELTSTKLNKIRQDMNRLKESIEKQVLFRKNQKL